MFTGIVQGLGVITEISAKRLCVDPGFEIQVSLGESIAINGCCLTVVEASSSWRFDLSAETLNRTAFRQKKVGDLVNFERAMTPLDRFGGHIVQGHVDAIGKLAKAESIGSDWHLTFEYPIEYDRYLIDKGSICVDGISLTVVQPTSGSFEAWIIPHTWQNTNLHTLNPGDDVNLEFDVIAKHVEKLLKKA